ncbi:MAG: hypothetical protein HRU26_15560 [Psychroserpens sp.]|nr:hypothetical protein [Psychroserpens sp.]
MQEKSMVDLYDEVNKRYSADCNECVMNLTNFGVSVSNVGSVIQLVLKMVGKEANRLPAASTANGIHDGKLALAQKQIQYAIMTDKSLCPDMLSHRSAYFQ